MSVSVVEMAVTGQGQGRGFNGGVELLLGPILAKLLWRWGEGIARLCLAGLPGVNHSWWLQGEQGQVGGSGEGGDSSGGHPARRGLALGGAQLILARESPAKPACPGQCAVLSP